eukprot:5116219-Amphidinium_carterae.1
MALGDKPPGNHPAVSSAHSASVKTATNQGRDSGSMLRCASSVSASEPGSVGDPLIPAHSSAAPTELMR